MEIVPYERDPEDPRPPWEAAASRTQSAAPDLGLPGLRTAGAFSRAARCSLCYSVRTDVTGGSQAVSNFTGVEKGFIRHGPQSISTRGTEIPVVQMITNLNRLDPRDRNHLKTAFPYKRAWLGSPGAAPRTSCPGRVNSLLSRGGGHSPR